MWIIPDTIITMAGEPLEGRAILVDGSRIADIIAAGQVPGDAEIKRYPGGIAFPAFVNMHTHLFYSGYRGIGDNLPLADWIYDRLVRIIRSVGDEEKADAIELGIRRSYEAGITTVLDAHLDAAVFDIALAKGLRGIFFLEAFGIYSLIQGNEIRRIKSGIEGMLERATDVTKVGFSPHASYTVTPAVLKQLVPWAREHGLPMSTHLGEVADEREYFAERKGVFAEKLRLFPAKPDLKCSSPFAYFEKYELLGPDLFAVHCVDINAGEMARLADTGTRVVTCPTSNAKLGCGIAPVSEMSAAGVDVFLGTDSEASCDEFDMFEEMRRLILFQRGRNRDVGNIDSKAALEMCTSNAARAAGFDDIGTIEVGKTADLVVAVPDADGVSGYRDAYSRLVWGAHKSDIRLVMTRGRVVYSCGEGENA